MNYFKILIIITIFILILLLKLNISEENFETKKIDLVFIQYFDNINSFICNRDKIWGNWVQSSFLLDLFKSFDLNKISCKIDNISDYTDNIDILIIGIEQSTPEILDSINNKYKPKVLFLLSDEFGNNNHLNKSISNFPLVYREYYYNHYDNPNNIKLLPLGYHCWDDNYIRYEKQKKLNERKYKWCFMGSLKNDREIMINKLKNNIQPYFCEKTKSGENSNIYNNSIFTICLRGNRNIDCFRQYTASINGSIPIVICNLNDYNQGYSKYPKECPFIRVDTVEDCIKKIKHLLKNENYDYLERLKYKQEEWWNFMRNDIESNIKNTIKI